MSDSDASQIKDRLTTLEVQMREKWVSHDRRSDERYTDLMDKMHELCQKFDCRPCSEHMKLMGDLNGRIKSVESWIDKAGWAIGVIYIALVGALIKHWIGL